MRFSNGAFKMSKDGRTGLFSSIISESKVTQKREVGFKATCMYLARGRKSFKPNCEVLEQKIHMRIRIFITSVKTTSRKRFEDNYSTILSGII